ncbi:hypothetical protein BOVA208_5208 [Bacteroides ovatus]|uniref:Uncharacterized protein n=1 Tax=Bacteroides ovatus (strain ATCC 8483 / DSM 1896 / JCM 5824 / BCRC 10623 / CCUG 4943 / NCTC 11153) TaxID=411476 RepID=A0AAN3D4T1_BACO1|nr:hypothetical protein BACOVA_04236 [Bacteroides ovatus ATCC 8483]CAG9901578.1 hypothetical protein BOVA713_4110 [Bacteroides ovatus]CAG9930954.1 hypothetical protein BOVA208_5208 [Bacteroides ovatus]
MTYGVFLSGAGDIYLHKDKTLLHLCVKKIFLPQNKAKDTACESPSFYLCSSI